MQSVTQLFAIVFVGVIISFEVSALENLKCRGLPITMTEQQITNIKECAATMGVPSIDKMTPDKIGCFSKCIMERKQLVDAAGKPHKENINALIDSTLPEPARADAKTNFAGCLDQHGGKIDPNDAKCSSYIELAMCTQQGMMEVCKG